MTTPYDPVPAAAAADGITALPAAMPVTFSSAGTLQLLTVSCLLLGWSAVETSGSAAASGSLLDGTDANGQPAAYFAMAAGATCTVPVPPPGVLCRNGLLAHVTSGAFKGVAWVIPLAPGA